MLRVFTAHLREEVLVTGCAIGRYRKLTSFTKRRIPASTALIDSVCGMAVVPSLGGWVRQSATGQHTVTTLSSVSQIAQNN